MIKRIFPVILVFLIAGCAGTALIGQPHTDTAKNVHLFFDKIKLDQTEVKHSIFVSSVKDPGNYRIAILYLKLNREKESVKSYDLSGIFLLNGSGKLSWNSGEHNQGGVLSQWKRDIAFRKPDPQSVILLFPYPINDPPHAILINGTEIKYKADTGILKSFRIIPGIIRLSGLL
ncbi:MAG: hypothetical protein JW874_03680 [Spirochaetales bacterium]|nr:hypothetical protein [Spirochaetales bacterium]